MFNPFRKKDKYNYSPALATRLIDIINEVKNCISDNSDMTFVYYETPKDFINVLDKYIQEIRKGNMKVIDDLSVEFAVTGSLQEHSLGNGWADEYLIIAKKFDKIKRLIKN
jgi:hypothetical protein